MIPSRLWRKALRLLAEFLLVVSLPFIAFCLCLFIIPNMIRWADLKINAQPFNSELWKSANERPRSSRIYMLEDLLDTHNLTGWTRTEVEDLLGEEDGSPEPGREGWTRVWYRVEGPFDTLQFLYDENGRVHNYGRGYD